MSLSYNQKRALLHLGVSVGVAAVLALIDIAEGYTAVDPTVKMLVIAAANALVSFLRRNDPGV